MSDEMDIQVKPEDEHDRPWQLPDNEPSAVIGEDGVEIEEDINVGS